MNYKLKVRYTKHFLEGALKHLDVPCECDFPDLKVAQMFANHFRMNETYKDCVTNHKWKLVSAPLIQRVMDVPNTI